MIFWIEYLETPLYKKNTIRPLRTLEKIKTLIIQFKNEIAAWEIPLFRGCVIQSMDNANLLFHNHESEDKLRYAYPLIQYKRINKMASIVCLEEAISAVGGFFASGRFLFQLGDREALMDINHVESNETAVEVSDEEYRYIIRKWLPLNSENYHAYRSMNGLVEQCSFLQDILVGNLLSFCKGVGVTIDKEIKCTITNILNTKSYSHKGVKMMGFDVEFKTNMSLPDYIGLGKGASMGFGMIKRMKINR